MFYLCCIRVKNHYYRVCQNRKQHEIMKLHMITLGSTFFISTCSFICDLLIFHDPPPSFPIDAILMTQHLERNLLHNCFICQGVLNSVYSLAVGMDQKAADIESCGDEISIYLADHSNWVEPLLPTQPGCPEVKFAYCTIFLFI